MSNQNPVLSKEYQDVTRDITSNEMLLETAKRIHDDDSCQVLHGELSRLYKVRMLLRKQETQEQQMAGAMTAAQHNRFPKGRW